jgi:hypothetical protein
LSYGESSKAEREVSLQGDVRSISVIAYQFGLLDFYEIGLASPIGGVVLGGEISMSVDMENPWKIHGFSTSNFL